MIAPTSTVAVHTSVAAHGALRRLWRRLTCALFALISLLVPGGGCDRGASPNVEKPNPSVTSEAGDGPVHVRLQVNPDKPTLSDNVEVLVEVKSQPGVVVQVEPYGPRLLADGRKFQMRVMDSQADSAVPQSDGSLRWTQRFRVEFVLAGDYELPPVEVAYSGMPEQAENPSVRADTSEKGAGSPSGKVATAPLKLTVVDTSGSALTPDALSQIRVLEPVELSRPRDWLWWAAPAAGVVLLLLLIMVFRSRRAASERSEPPIPAHEWARARLVELLAEDLLLRGRSQDFFYRLSGIARGYIERRFRVSAPEMTTEEFLASAATDRRFSAAHTRSLGVFLEACDLVKYARHEPRREEANEAFKAAQDFVEQTREREAGATTDAGLAPAELPTVQEARA